MSNELISQMNIEQNFDDFTNFNYEKIKELENRNLLVVSNTINALMERKLQNSSPIDEFIVRYFTFDNKQLMTQNDFLRGVENLVIKPELIMNIVANKYEQENIRDIAKDIVSKTDKENAKKYFEISEKKIRYILMNSQ